MVARTEAVLKYIQAFKITTGYSPSQREVADYFGVSQPTILADLRKLRDEGKLTWEDGKARSIQVTENE